jgi:hypothetical protein
VQDIAYGVKPEAVFAEVHAATGDWKRNARVQEDIRVDNKVTGVGSCQATSRTPIFVPTFGAIAGIESGLDGLDGLGTDERYPNKIHRRTAAWAASGAEKATLLARSTGMNIA